MLLYGPHAPAGVYGDSLDLVGLVGTYDMGLDHLGSAEAPSTLENLGSADDDEAPSNLGRETSFYGCQGADGLPGWGSGGSQGSGSAAPRLFLWLGSSIGNLERGAAAAFLKRLRAVAMRPGGGGGV